MSQIPSVGRPSGASRSVSKIPVVRKYTERALRVQESATETSLPQGKGGNAIFSRPSGASRIKLVSSVKGSAVPGKEVSNSAFSNISAALVSASNRPSGARRVVVKASESNIPPSEPSTPAPPVPEQVQTKKRALITGGNTGIGFETAKALAEQGYEVVIACRSAERGNLAVEKLKELVPGELISMSLLQLDDLSSVRDFYKRFQDEGKPIDVLINNAGVMACPEMRTKDGFEYQLGVNHLGHFVLTAGLLPLITDPARSTRIINVSSSAQFFGDINFENPNLDGNYNPWVAYGQSKLANTFFTFELAKRLKDNPTITCNCLHPGVVNTELARYIKPDDNNVFAKVLPAVLERLLFIKTPVEGAQTSIFLASSEDVEGMSGKYYDNCQPTVANWKAYMSDSRARFWELSENLTGESFDTSVLVNGGGAAVEPVQV